MGMPCTWFPIPFEKLISSLVKTRMVQMLGNTLKPSSIQITTIQAVQANEGPEERINDSIDTFKVMTKTWFSEPISIYLTALFEQSYRTDR